MSDNDSVTSQAQRKQRLKSYVMRRLRERERGTDGAGGHRPTQTAVFLLTQHNLHLGYTPPVSTLTNVRLILQYRQTIYRPTAHRGNIFHSSDVGSFQIALGKWKMAPKTQQACWSVAV